MRTYSAVVDGAPAEAGVKRANRMREQKAPERARAATYERQQKIAEDVAEMAQNIGRTNDQAGLLRVLDTYVEARHTTTGVTKRELLDDITKAFDESGMRLSFTKYQKRGADGKLQKGFESSGQMGIVGALRRRRNAASKKSTARR